ncbi:hypothetical protein Cni_G28711 [Canna indica]|uniref:Dof zinc finger protein n=1 Tax=Canna indica TaxID=4628 RepID=A0AAQ3L3H5_9LILI|nr:hypothetical protein Cni_G28711 [Canna indica]
MQDFGAIPGLAGHIFSAARGGGRLGGYSSPATPVKCPRCDSTDTKFCYYNNYNLAQPRHFCKSCRRYWTKGGVLRNVPVGGGCRKSKSSSSSSSSSRSSSDAAPHKVLPSQPLSTLADANNISLHNSALLVSNSDPGPNLTNSLEPSAPMEAPLVQAAEIFAGTTTVVSNFTSLYSTVPAPMISSFSCSPLVPLPQPTAEEGVAAQPVFMDQAAPLIPLQLHSTTAEEVRMQPGFIEQPAPPIQLQIQSTTEKEVRALQGFMSRAVPMDDRGTSTADWSFVAVDPTLFGHSATVDAAAMYWSHGNWGDADPALYLA